MHLALLIIWAVGILVVSKIQEYKIRKRCENRKKKNAELPLWPYGKDLEEIEKQCLTGRTSNGYTAEVIKGVFPTLPPKDILAWMMVFEIKHRGYKPIKSEIDEYLNLDAEYYNQWIKSLSKEELQQIVDYKYNFSDWPKDNAKRY